MAIGGKRSSFLGCFLLLGSFSRSSPPPLTPSSPAICTYVPGDENWPSDVDWAKLNDTVDGNLISTVPQAAVCHDSGPLSGFYSEAACKGLREGWNLATTFLRHPAEFMNPYFQNQTCDPFTPTTQTCHLGNYVSYSINVTKAEHVIAGLQFAETKNVRLVVKTTGHDFLGRSTGHGALSLWMWNLKTAMPDLQYSRPWYSGAAIKLGAGVTGGEAYEVAAPLGYRVVGGECGSVSVAGGWSQGGGHSMLTSAYGMGADQVLEWEVVTTISGGARAVVVVTPENEYSDLYWALSGGGGGNYAVVLSVTVKMHHDGPVGGGSLSFANNGDDAYWSAVGLWHQHAPAIVGHNNTVIYTVQSTGFLAYAITLPDEPSSALDGLLAPFLADLRSLGIVYELNKTDSANYLDHFNRYYGPAPYGTQPPTTTLMSRLVPAEIATKANATAAFVDALRSIVADGTFLVGCLLVNASSSSSSSPHPDNAVSQGWRNAFVGCNMNAYWNFTAPLASNLATKHEMVERHIPAWEAATPGGAIYLNEMDPWYRGDWKGQIYQEKYERLLGIKKVYDPSHLLWGRFAVGSDQLQLDDNGKLCGRGY